MNTLTGFKIPELRFSSMAIARVGSGSVFCHPMFFQKGQRSLQLRKGKDFQGHRFAKLTQYPQKRLDIIVGKGGQFQMVAIVLKTMEMDCGGFCTIVIKCAFDIISMQQQVPEVKANLQPQFVDDVGEQLAGIIQRFDPDGIRLYSGGKDFSEIGKRLILPSFYGCCFSTWFIAVLSS